MNLQIKALAKEFGFDAFGVTRVSGLEEGAKAIEQWVSEGRHGSMKYLENFSERQKKFYEDFPDAKTVLVLGVNYYTGPVPGMSGGNLTGRVARYAWGKDYHQVIAKRHEAFIEKLKEITGPSLRAKSCVDIQPVPERFAAQKAGLGFHGKHTGVLSAEFGPWLFLSEIVTNLELEEDLPAEGDCGTCDHCQKICPTGALDTDYSIDARLCIAYWTIENKGIIPRAMRPKIKDWIFGCDECFAVCPFTSKSKESGWKELGPEAGKGEWLLIAKLFEIHSNKQYEQEFSGTAILRAGRKQMMRNACVVLGNSGKQEAVPLLIIGLSDPAPLVRLHAAWGLGQLIHEDSRRALLERARREDDREVKEEIDLALKSFS